MSKPFLTLVEATALQKLAEKAVKECKDDGQTIEPGNYEFDVTVRCDGALSRGNDTTATPSFKFPEYLKPLILKYASTLGKQKGQQWLESLMDAKGALGAIVELGPDAVLKSIDPTLVSIWDEGEAEAKKRYQKVTPKAGRAGNTVVVGQIEPAVTPVTPKVVPKVAGKKRPS